MDPKDHCSGWETNGTLPSLSEHEIHVYKTCLSNNNNLPETFKHLLMQDLSIDEMSKFNNYHFDVDKNRYLMARAGLKHILSRYTQLPPKDHLFDYSPFSKPSLRSSNNPARVHFNVSHSENCIIYAFSNQKELGVDVEQFKNEENHQCRKNDPELLEIARDFFTDNEYVKLKSLKEEERPLAFYRCWTRKEAFLKAIGLGLSFPLNQVEVSLLNGEPNKILSIGIGEIKPSLWNLFELFPYPNYLTTIATTQKLEKIVLWNLILVG